MERNKLTAEINSFQNLWSGGFRTGYNQKRGQNRLEKYLSENLAGETLLEIGCGGGQWTKFISALNIFKKIYCVDVLSEQHNKFWEYVGQENRDLISYTKVKDFNLDHIKNESLDYVFSYDVFCHISEQGVKAYLESIYKKCKKDALILLMFADPKKYLSSEPENKNHVIRYLPRDKFIYKFSNKKLIEDALLDSDGVPFPGRWYWLGKEKFFSLAENQNFFTLAEDIEVDYTNPICLLKK